ncbi:transcriptional regulator domain-containing protein [Variovorax sp. LT2P21]|uniref:transcriptional regulator domain-containing protein n=1 Tax=Variovorax sp. LT2P21 TaxID=3443731 RepID=UPI003F4680D3
MSLHDIEDQPRAPWAVSAAYLYTLDLDGPALAWEYLRRNPMYRAEHAAWARRRSAWFERWGLRCCRGPAPGCARGASALARVR